MNYSEILEKLQDYFKSLVIIQYRCSTKNRALIDILTKLLFAQMILLQIQNGCLNVEESVGVQLDTVGEWVGLDRYYDNSALWDRAYFSFIDWNKTPIPLFQGGFSNYKNFEYLDGYTMTWKHLQDLKQAKYKLGDEFYRKLIKLKIIKNSIRFTKKNIDDAIYEWSGGQVYATWSKMELTYHYTGKYSQYIALALFKNCLPCPVGCELKTELIS